VLTAAPADFALLDPVRNDPRITSTIVPTEHATTFELDYTGPQRRIWMRKRATDLRVENLPETLRRAPVCLLVPVIDEVPSTARSSLACEVCVAGIQGWLRAVDTSGEVIAGRSKSLDTFPAGFDGVVFSELDHPDSEGIAAELAKKARTVVLTRGAAGATLWMANKTFLVPPAFASEVEPTGAGDVFAVVYAIALGRGAAPLTAATVASEAAARVVEGPGIGRLKESWADRFADPPNL